MIIGIDLGTTNSLVAVWKDGKAQIIPNALGQNLTPSVVGLDDKGQVIVGLAARERLFLYPARTAAVFKRAMGTGKIYRLGSKAFRPEELSALVLRALKADAEAWLGQEVHEAVISVPAYFNDIQRKATQTAGKLAGLKVERLINEPTAAAMAYGLHEQLPESTYLVLDLGGGTFDVTMLEIFDGIMEVRASAGDNYLGGEDFTSCLVDDFLATTGARAGLLRADLDESQLSALHSQAERAKCTLSNSEQATICLSWKGEELIHTVSSEDFERLVALLTLRFRQPLERVLRDTTVGMRDLDEIVLVGGATRMPLIRRLVSRLFGRLPACNLHPDEAVATGVAVLAGLKMRDANLREVVMTDVSSYTLGTSVSERHEGSRISGLYLPIIERNTPIPVSRQKRVYTAVDNQTTVTIDVYQGEMPMAKDNINLGSFDVLLPPTPAGQPLDIRFTYDLNGLLEVEVTVEANKKQYRQVFIENPDVLSPEEIEARLARLAALKIHPREQTENLTLISRGERLYAECLGERREAVGHALARFLLVMERQDPGEIAVERSRISREFDLLEDFL